MDEAPPPVPEPWHPAGFWIRFAADLIDSLVVYFPVGFVTTAAAAFGTPNATAIVLLKALTAIAVGGVYYTVLTGRSGQTWGKKAFDIKVVNQDGTPLTYGAAFGRWCAYLPSYLTLGIGFMMAGWNEERKALHDRIIGTRVIRKGPASGGRSPGKAIGIIAAIAAVLFAAALAGLVHWLRSNKGKLDEQRRAIATEAAAFAGKTDQEGCVKESLSRLAGAGFMDQVRDGVFLENCLGAARPSETFCDAVPPENSIMATVAWRSQVCEKYGHPNDPACGRLLAAIQRHCRQAPPPPPRI
ncbi:MAG: RDD family protein [Elusimicrobia bacterium]|nr:RDD family protein [Elusimicrobiota bacterium]